MKTSLFKAVRVMLQLLLPLLISQVGASALHAANSITQYGITWTFDKDYPSGRFCNGDYWVTGPVKIISITTDMHAPGFTPKPGQDGTMVNPGTNDKQGYDNRLTSYDARLNAALIDGKPLSPKNPLVLKPEYKNARMTGGTPARWT